MDVNLDMEIASERINPPTARQILRPLLPCERRSWSQIEEHYEIETELAEKLRNAHKSKRGSLYTELYDELFRRVPHHQMLTNKRSSQEEQKRIDRQMAFLLRHVESDEAFMEIGAGSCALTRAIAPYCRNVLATDVSHVIAEGEPLPKNCTFAVTAGCDMPTPDGSIDVAYSNQLMEHLHPEDALEQLRNIYKALKPGGVYICVTPNRVAGPWDISMYFDEVARGFHLQEYTAGELTDIMHKAGFRKVKFYAGGRGLFFRIPHGVVRILEWLLSRLPYSIRCKIAHTLPIRGVLGLRAIAEK